MLNTIMAAAEYFSLHRVWLYCTGVVSCFQTCYINNLCSDATQECVSMYADLNTVYKQKITFQNIRNLKKLKLFNLNIDIFTRVSSELGRYVMFCVVAYIGLLHKYVWVSYIKNSLDSLKCSGISINM